ncbi:MAG: hypothetical protein Q9214_007082, partial [Letrouitia sp. 1 TL-2023]
MAQGAPLLDSSSERHDEAPSPFMNDRSSLSRNFNPNEQSWRLCKEGAPYLACTVVVVLATLATVKIYQDKGFVDHGNKINFNVIITVLNIILALNFLVSLHQVDPHRYCLTTATGSFQEHGKDVEVEGLTYSWDGGTNSTGIVTSPGSVVVPKLDCYYDDGRCYTTPDAPTEAAPFLAHTYGETASSLFRCPYTTDEDIFQANQSCAYFTNTAKPEFAYRYLEFNPDDVAGVYPYLTKRLVKASPSECSQYETFRSRDERDRYGLTLWHFNDGAENKTISIPLVNTALDSTTYIYNDTTIPQDSIDQACGPRCLYVYALRQQGPRRNNTLNTLFQCQINITNVTNIGDQVQVLADRNARLAAASIALTGRYTNLISRDVKEWRQYQLYPFGYRLSLFFPSFLLVHWLIYSSSFWETDTLSPTGVGSLIAQFAIGSLSVMASVNPPTEIPSPRSPTLGYHLSVHWDFFIAILAAISGVHFLLMYATVVLSRPVVVGDDSNLVSAR